MTTSENDKAILDKLQAKGLCVGEEAKLFFPDEGESYKQGFLICSECPLRQECAEYGIRNMEFGLWGGLTPIDRKRIRRARKHNLAKDIIEVANHGNGTKSWKLHIERGETDCEVCYKAFAKAVPARVIAQNFKSQRNVETRIERDAKSD